MAGLWAIIESELSVNLFKNPVFGNGTTNWANTNGSLTTDTTASNLLFGAAAGYYSGSGLAANSGVNGDLDVTAGAVTGQVEFWIKGTAPEKLGVYDGVWVYSGTPTVIETGPNGYSRYAATFSSTDMNGVTKAGAFWSGTVAAYIGGAQCEQSSTYTTQIAGDMGSGYVWNGTEHASVSTRYILDPDGKTVWGGAIIDIDDRVNVTCEVTVGAGLLPLEIEKLAMAGEVQNLFVGHGLQPRDIRVALALNASTFAGAHTRRAALLATLPYGREVWLRYNGANATIEIKAAVTGSFDMDLSKSRMGRRTTLGFSALDPRFRIIGPERTTLAFSASPSSSYARRRTDKDGWGAMTSGAFAAFRRAVQGPDGTIYAGTVNNGGTAKLQKWTGAAWVDMVSFTGSITAGPYIADIIPNADWTKLWVLGDYTTVAGTAGHGGVAEITISSNAAAKLGTGASGGVPLCGSYVRSLNRLYVGGLFATNMGGVANTSYFCYWDGAAWQSVGTTRPTAGVYCLVQDAQEALTLGGDFTNTWALGNMSATTASLATGGVKYNPQQWYYRVVGRDSAGGLTTGADSATLTATSTQGSANISWSALTGAAGYRLFVYEATTGSSRRNPGGAAAWTAVIDLPAGTLSYYDDGTAYLAALRSAEHTPPSGNTTGNYGTRIVQFVPSTGVWVRMAQKAGGFNGIVRTLALAGHGGTLLAGGSFTQVDGGAANRVAYTRGKRWLPLGSSGMSSGQVNRMIYDQGRVWAVGSFADADGNTLAALLARLDGFPLAGWTHTDVALTNSSNNAYDVIATPYRLMVFDDTSYSSAPGAAGIAYTGTANLYPRIRVTGPGTLRWLENALTRARLIFNYTLQAGEKLIIDCDKRKVTSTLRGDITRLVHPASQLDGFYLVAAQTQTVWAHMTGTTGASGVVLEGYRALLTGDV